jgi:NADP-dependent 3-hydroxy acid dehydrogenase YdfG
MFPDDFTDSSRSGEGRLTMSKYSGKRLQGAAALITGGSGGIGLAIAQVLVQEGAGVTIVGRRLHKLTAAARSLRELGGDVLEVSADLTSDDAIEEAVEAHRSRFNRMDVLVNNAGVAFASKPGRQKPDAMKEVVAVDFSSVLVLYRLTLDMLLSASEERGTARVINLASITGRHPQPWLAVYSACKAAVISYTHSMNQAYAAKGLVSTAVCPGFVDTAMSENAQNVESEDMITAEDVAEVVRSVLSLSSRSYIPEVHIARSRSADQSGL